MSVVRAGNQERAAIPALAFLCHNIGGRARFAVRRRRKYPIRSSFRGARKREPGVSLPGLCAHIISRFRVRFAPRNDVRAQTKTKPAFPGLVHCCARPGYRKTRLSQIAAKALDAFAGVLEIGSLGRVGNAERRAEPERRTDRKSTRLNSSHRCISYAVF